MLLVHAEHWIHACNIPMQLYRMLHIIYKKAFAYNAKELKNEVLV